METKNLTKEVQIQIYKKAFEIATDFRGTYRDRFEKVHTDSKDAESLEINFRKKCLEIAVKELKSDILLDKNKLPRMKPCKCGGKRRSRIYSTATNILTLVCDKCGYQVSGESEREARINWNREMEKNNA